MTTFTAAELAKEAEREAKYRRWVYPRLVSDGRMSAAEAERRISMMETIAGKLRKEEEEKERLL
ncbi:hypothetical protein [Mesorhizobium sp.]|uniref:hypothetical protein n=1 Tax=Mesorhizobium sp. TaxID=1871066 RepID=UPI000FE605FB|nr:hypothetical protein [Mesorhizobium sp.]RWP05077.1 MAG: hypothetical protein EOQ99_16530 [Mesorhizobium sp.]